MIHFKQLHQSAKLPERQHSGDAGLDLRALKGVVLEPKKQTIIDTGIAVEIPEGHVGLVVPRSGLAFKHGITLTNSPGIIDCGYRGEVKLAVFNHGENFVTVNPGDRVAQLVVVPVLLAEPEFVENLSNADRATAGFGSTGTQ